MKNITQKEGKKQPKIKVKSKNLIGLPEVWKWEAVWEQADFMYPCTTWNHARRFVAAMKLIKRVIIKMGNSQEKTQPSQSFD